MMRAHLVRGGACLLALLLIAEAVLLGMAPVPGTRDPEAVLRRTPLAVDALSSLALTREKQGRDAEAATLMNLAAAGGWWDDPTQIWMFDRARALGRYDIATERADALLRRGQLTDALYPMLRDIARTPSGMAALVSRLEDRPSWRGDFLARLDPMAPTDDRLWSALDHSAAPPSPRERILRVNALLGARRYAAARQAWTAGHVAPLVSDGNFTEAARPLEEGPAAPFGWTLSDGSGSTAEIGDPDRPLSGPALEVHVEPGFADVLASQLIVLPPRSYRLSFALFNPDRAPPGALGWIVRCLGEGQIDRPAEVARQRRRDGWVEVAASFTVPADCPAQRLELRADGQALSPVEYWFDRIAVAPR